MRSDAGPEAIASNNHPPLGGLKYLSPKRCVARLRRVDTLIIGHIHAPMHFHLQQGKELLVVSDWQPHSQPATLASMAQGNGN